MPIADQYDFEAVLDDARIGNDPSPGYLKRVEMLDNVVRNCMHLSRQCGGIPAPTSKHFYASVLFTALIARGVSLAIAAPHTPWAAKKIEHWDYSTATGIARTMLELRLAFFYLCVDECNEDEWQCRWNLLNLHDCCTRIKLFATRPDGAEQVAGFTRQADELRERLRSNRCFMALAPKQRNHFLKGSSAYLYPLEDICEKSGVDKATYKWLHILFSSHVHGLPMSYYRMGNGEGERGRGLPSAVEESYTSLCLSLASAMLVETHDEIEVLFKDSEKAKILPEGPSKESQVEITAESREQFAIGESRTILRTEAVRVDVTRETEDELRLTYYHQSSNEIVLRRILSEESSELEFYDQTFWKVLVNGAAATDSFLDDIERKRMAYRVDPHNRVLHFKIEDRE